MFCTCCLANETCLCSEKQFIFLFAILTMPLVSKGDHLVGGEIYYECLGNDDYLITLKVYRDCFSSGAPFDSPASIAVYDANGGLVTALNAFHNGGQQNTGDY